MILCRFFGEKGKRKIRKRDREKGKEKREKAKIYRLKEGERKRNGETGRKRQ
jgi:hypothetical protein